MNGTQPYRCCRCMQGFNVGDRYRYDGFSIYHFACYLAKVKEGTA